MNQQLIYSRHHRSQAQRSAPCSTDQKTSTRQEQFGYCVRIQCASRFVCPAHGPTA